MFKNYTKEEEQLQRKFWIDVYIGILKGLQNMPPQQKLDLAKMAADDALKHYESKHKK